MRRRLTSRAAPLLVGMCIAVSLAASAPSAALADQYDDAAYVGWVLNAVRADEGVAPLTVDDDLSWLAQSWADELAAGGFLAHNPGLADAMGAWWAWGENVGEGGSIDQIVDALINSRSHYENMVDPAYWAMGVAVAYGADGTAYVVEVFGG